MQKKKSLKKPESKDPNESKKDKKTPAAPADDDGWDLDVDEASENDIIEDESDNEDDDGTSGSKKPKVKIEQTVVKIKDLKSGMAHVTVEAKIDFVGEGNRKGASYGENIYVPAFIRDETGEVKLWFWNDDARKAKAGKKIRVVDGYVSTFRGELQLNTNKKKGVEFL